MGWIDFAAAYNKGTIAWALVLLLPSDWRLRRWEQLLCVIAVWLESMALDRFKNSVMLVHVLVLGILLMRKQRPFKQNLTGAMQAVFWAWACVMFMGSVLSLLIPGLFGGMTMSCITSTLLLLSAFLWRLSGRTAEKEISQSVRNYRAWIELSIMAYFSFVIPLLPIRSEKVMAILILSLLVLLAIVSAVMQRMNYVALDAQRMKLEQEMAQYRYSKAFGIRHYFMKLYALFGEDLARRDIDAAIRHYEREIGPLYEEMMDIRNAVKLPSERLSRLINHTLREIGALKGITVHIEVQENIAILEEDKLLRIMTIWLDNAVEALKKQDEGMFRIRIKMVKGKRLLVHIANSIDVNGRSFEEIIAQETEERGFGLPLADSIIRATPSMQHDSYISGTEDYYKRLFIQQLTIG